MRIWPDPHRAAGKSVGSRAIGGAVVGHQPLDSDSVGTVEADRPLEESFNLYARMGLRASRVDPRLIRIDLE